MVNVWAGTGGAVLIGIAAFGFLYPVNSQGNTIFDLNNLCDSQMGRMGQMLSNFFGVGQIEQKCSEIKYTTYGIIGLALGGIILVTVGALVPSKRKENPLTCPYCNHVASSDTDLLRHKSENHLDKSPFKCKYCDFIGITEEILRNHNQDIHSDKKKW